MDQNNQTVELIDPQLVHAHHEVEEQVLEAERMAMESQSVSAIRTDGR